MPVTQRSRERVDSLLVALAAEYGEFRVREETWNTTQAAYDRLEERFEAGSNGGAGIWVRDTDRRVLLVRHEGEERWSEPSGKREPGETFSETARREVAEETGIEAGIDGVLEVTVVTHDAWDRQPLVSPIVLFAGEKEGGSLDPRDGEIAEVDWWTEAPDSVLYDAVEEYPYPDE
jgi:ADP-ribose pyrophosphatase YjhB (NUDIX family)